MRNGATGLLSLGGLALVTALSAQRAVAGELSPFALLAVVCWPARPSVRWKSLIRPSTLHGRVMRRRAADPISSLDAIPGVPEPY